MSDNSGDGAIFVWQFEDHRSFDESGAPKLPNVERSSHVTHVKHTYDLREDDSPEDPTLSEPPTPARSRHRAE